MLRYTASTYAYGSCPLKSKFCPNTPQRIVPRDVNEDARDRARALDGTPAFEESSNQRKKIEMRFAHLKTHHRFERMRLRGLSVNIGCLRSKSITSMVNPSKGRDR